MNTLLLLALLAVAAVVLWRRRPSSLAPEPPANPYARDDAFGRPDAGPHLDPQYPRAPLPQGDLGGSLVRGVATGLAIGAGAAAAQEIGRRMFEHGGDAATARDHDAPAGAVEHGAASHSSLAHDAGLDALDAQSRHDGFVGADGLSPADGWDADGFGAGGDDCER